MDFFEIINSIIAFSQANILIAIVAALFLFLFLYLRPKLFFTLFFIVLVMAGVFYLITSLSSTGVTHKGKMIQQRDLP